MSLRRRLGHSIQWRLVLVFLLLAGGLSFVFISGAQQAFAVGWREAARPLIADYLDRLAADVTGGGPAPRIERAQALVQRLPITITVRDAQQHLTWASHPAQAHRLEALHGLESDTDGRASLLLRHTADGHSIAFGINHEFIERRPHLLGAALLALLGLTLAAWLYARRLLQPLADIGAGAQRFGRGDFSQPIPVRHAQRPDELGQLAQTVNAMGRDIHQMLEAKRALLLAISHELRSPLTRARLHAELLPDTTDLSAQRQALLRDLQEMASLVNDLLESERLAGRHASLQREPVDLPALAREVLTDLQARHPAASQVQWQVDADLPRMSLDAARMRLLLRNLLDNALRHASDAASPPTLSLSRDGDGVCLVLRDHGPGVPEAQLAQLAQAFYRPDGARTRGAGGVGLGLYLCRLVVEAHGGRFTLAPAHPGLRAEIHL
jgi:signal transduction histidine kinase